MTSSRRVNCRSVKPSRKRSLTVASSPHNNGEGIGGGGTCRPVILNSWPIKPSGVQFAMATRRRAGRHAPFRRDALRSRGKHRAEHRHDFIKRGICVRQGLGVALVKLDLNAFGLRRARAVPAGSAQYHASHDGSRARRRERQIARAASYVKHAARRVLAASAR